MCPDHETLESLALGLLSEEELAPLEEHLETCHECLQTLPGTDPPDVVIEALRAAPQTLERRAEIADEIRRVEAAAIAQLRKPWGEDRSKVQSPRSKVGKSGDDRYLTTPPPSVVDDTSAFNSRFSPGAPRPDPRTELDENDELRDFLSPPEAADEMGRLGGYRVLRALGSGGMGVVFEAEDPLLKRHVALKVMKPNVASISARKRFLREAQTAASVEHDHIVPVYQVGEDRGVPFIAMPLLRGQTLAERLDSVGSGRRAVPAAAGERRQAPGVRHQEGSRSRVQGAEERVDVEPRAYSSHLAPRDVTDHAQRDHLSGEAASIPLSPDRQAGAPGRSEGGPLRTLANDAAEEIASRKLDERGENLPLSPHPPHGPLRNEDLARIGHEIALGLAAAHRRGLIHRDIKPSNIWLEEETDRVKILDFGLARVVDSAEQLTHAGTLLGTPAYMSPEQASGVEADARSDLFSLGCVLYHAATGRRPFLGRDALTTLLAVTTTEPPAPRELNPSLPDDLNDLIVSLLSKDPAGRPQSAREVADRLAAVGNGLRAVPAEGSGFGVQASGQQPDADPRAYSSHHAPRDGTDHAERDQSSGEAALLPRPPDPQAGAPGRNEGVLNEAVFTIDSVAPAAVASPDLLAHAVPAKTPHRRRVLIGLALAAAAVLLAGIIITIKNEKGETVARINGDQSVVVENLDPRHTATVASSDSVAPIPARRDDGDAVVAGGSMPPAADNTPPAGFHALLNGKDLTGWKGVPKPPFDNPIQRAKASRGDLAAAQALADEEMLKHWSVKDGILVFDGRGQSLATDKEYSDFELWIDWKIEPGGDSGIYLRGAPQVQIWDPSSASAGGVGSGGLYNNQRYPSQPAAAADRPVGEWNTLKIRMIGERVAVKLNDVLVVDNVVLENFWDRGAPIFPTGQIELQNQTGPLYFKNIYLREPAGADLSTADAAGFVSLFDGKTLDGWQIVNKRGAGYVVEDGVLVCPTEGGGNPLPPQTVVIPFGD